VFKEFILVEAPQLPESSSIEVNLLSTDALNVLTDEVVAYEPVLPPITSNLSLTLLLNEFNEFIEAVCELFVDKAVDADVLRELALTTKLLALISKLFISLSEDVVYAVKELAVTCKAENDANAEAVNVFIELIEPVKANVSPTDCV
jgi:hypothetical protein